MKNKKYAMRRAISLLLSAGMTVGLLGTGIAGATDVTDSSDSAAETVVETEVNSENETDAGTDLSDADALSEDEIADAADDEAPLTASAELKDITEAIPEGISLNGIDIGGKTGAEIYDAVAAYVAEVAENVITFTIHDAKESATLGEFGCSWANEGEVAEALSGMYDGNLMDQYKKLKDVTDGGELPEVELTFDTDSIRARLESYSEIYDQPAVEAGVERIDGVFVVTESQTGVALDIEAAKEAAVEAVMNWDGVSNLEVEVETTITEPTVTTDMYEGFGAVLGTETTSYATSNSARSRNVEQAAANMNGHWFMPDEEVSYNDMIAPVTAEGGYDYAPSYVDGAQINTIGGGICQVATTLYVAALQAEMETVYRKNHSYTVDYEPESMDATVYPADGLDYKFKNNTGHPIYIEAYCSNRSVTITIYGVETRPANRTIEYVSTVLSIEKSGVASDEPDSGMAAGTVTYLNPAHSKIHSTLTKNVYVDGVLTESTLINDDYYKPMAANRRYGAPVDSEGNSNYYVRDDGYVVKLEDKDNPNAETYRLNPDGTFLDDPLGKDEDTDEDADTEEDSDTSAKDDSSKKDSSSDKQTSANKETTASEDAASKETTQAGTEQTEETTAAAETETSAAAEE